MNTAYRPTMVSDNGNLVFSTGANKEIRFQPAVNGSVKVGGEDLTLLMNQVRCTSYTHTYMHTCVHILMVSAKDHVLFSFIL